MDVPTFAELLAPGGQAALKLAESLHSRGLGTLQLLDHLRKQFSVPLATAAADTVLLRAKAAKKFTNAHDLYFTSEALEVSSGEIISTYRANRFSRWESVADLCCGIGADSLQLARRGLQVQAVDQDPLRVAMARANAEASGLSSRITLHEANVLTDPLPEAPAYFVDPGRRVSGQRFLALEDYLPPPRALLQRLPADVPIAFKLAPGIQRGELEAFPGEREFVSVDGEMKESILWLGALWSAGWRATLLPTGDTLTSEDRPFPQPAGEIRAYLYDPDAAVVRADLVPILGEQLQAEPIDDIVQILTTDQLQPTPFAQAYRVIETLKYDTRAIIQNLKTREIGRITPIMRGAPDNASELVPKGKLRGPHHAFLLLTRAMGKPVAILADRV